MLNEEQILKAAITHIKTAFASDGVSVYPKNQDKPASFPCIVLTLSSQVSSSGIYGEILANVQIHVTVYANNVYAKAGSYDGIHTIFDKLNVVMSEKHYQRSNQTEPHYNQQYRCWNKDGYFTKKSNTF